MGSCTTCGQLIIDWSQLVVLNKNAASRLSIVSSNREYLCMHFGCCLYCTLTSAALQTAGNVRLPALNIRPRKSAGLGLMSFQYSEHCTPVLQ